MRKAILFLPARINTAFSGGFVYKYTFLLHNIHFSGPLLCQKSGAKSKQTCAAIVSLLSSSSSPPAFLFLCHDKKPRLSQGKFSEFLCFFIFCFFFLRQSPRKYIFTLPRSPALHLRPASESCAFPLFLRSSCKSVSLWLRGSSLCPVCPSIRCSTPGTLSQTSPSGTGP